MPQGPYIIPPGTQMDWTEDAELHKRYTEWRQEVQLILETILSNVKDTKTKVKYRTLWAGKEACTYLSTVERTPEEQSRKHVPNLR